MQHGGWAAPGGETKPIQFLLRNDTVAIAAIKTFPVIIETRFLGSGFGRKLNRHSESVNHFFNHIPPQLIIAEESTNQYLNENWRPVNDGLKGVIATTIEDILVKIMRKIFDQVPASYLISDIPKPSQFNKT